MNEDQEPDEGWIELLFMPKVWGIIALLFFMATAGFWLIYMAIPILILIGVVMLLGAVGNVVSDEVHDRYYDE